MSKLFKSGLKYRWGYTPMLYAGSVKVDLIFIVILLVLILLIGIKTDWAGF